MGKSAEKTSSYVTDGKRGMSMINNRNWIVVALAIIAVCSGCASMSSVETEHDEFTGVQSIEMTYNPLAGATPLDDAQVRLQAVRGTDEGKETDVYAIRLVLYGNGGGWCFIESGESLRFLIDGERFALSGDGSTDSREVLSGARTAEVALYVTDLDFIRKLSEASEVKVRIEGSRRNVERHFSESNFENFREFVAQCTGLAQTE